MSPEEIQANRLKWIETLETTTRLQTTGRLRLHDTETGVPAYCCVGVGAILAGANEDVPDYNFNDVDNWVKFQRWIGLGLDFKDAIHIHDDLTKFYRWNDNDGLTFKQIASKLRRLWKLPKSKYPSKKGTNP